jgi:hypothetical protein
MNLSLFRKWSSVFLALGLVLALMAPALAQELTVVDHKIAEDVQGDGTPLPATTFLFDDDRAISWVRLDGELENQKLRWEFYDPKGHLYASEQQFVFYSELHWAWITIDGTAASKIIGQWSVKFYIENKLQFEDKFTITTIGSPPPPDDGGGNNGGDNNNSGLTVSKHLIAEDVEGDGTPSPVSSFLFDDDRAISWVRLTGNFANQQLRWEFFDPNGHLYATEQHGVGNAQTHWVWIIIKNTAAAKLIGQWTVKFYINNTFQYQDTFAITTQGNPPPPPPPDDGGGSDNSSLKIDKHLIAQDVKGDGTPVSGESFIYSDDRAISWVKLSGNFQNQMLRWEFLDPKGNLYASEQHSVGSSQIHWVWITINGTAAAKLIGKWRVKFYIENKIQFEDTFTISLGIVPPPPPPDDGSNGETLKIAKHLIAKDILGDGTPVPGDTFLFDENRAISWVRFEGTFANQKLRWEFLDPKGNLYASEQHSVGLAQLHWVWISIKGTAASKIYGQWSVKFYIENKLQFEDKFTITSKDVPPPSVNFIVCAAGADGFFDSSEISAIVKAWDKSEEYKDCGAPSDSDILQILHLWARGKSVNAAALDPKVQAFTVESVTREVARSDTLAFTVAGQNIASVKIELFDLKGQLLSQSEALGNRVQLSPNGRLANGVYLYAITVSGANGLTWRKLEKLSFKR